MLCDGTLCETCGAPATCRVADLREITRPEEVVARWAKNGAPHNFCAEHKRGSISTYLDGTVETREQRQALRELTDNAQL